ncbi:hypothetical protein [Pseudomonas sp. BN515]|uniref:hypothetical protein n=1 Tax=Pseudomonas sp. BN515 TaxID=2567892 RepID=UPI0024537BC5|nr:hypothetical protein [Pseudomonas sp. BN515]MDH4873048.1 hypothetical protein [Pseudomonas sp. BN515]
MKNAIPNPPLQASRITANASTGFKVTTADGRPARLAVVDDEGNVIEAGQDLAWAAWRVCVEVQENFWEGMGWLEVHTSPPGDPVLVERLMGKAA